MPLRTLVHSTQPNLNALNVDSQWERRFCRVSQHRISELRRGTPSPRLLVCEALGLVDLFCAAPSSPLHTGCCYSRVKASLTTADLGDNGVPPHSASTA